MTSKFIWKIAESWAIEKVIKDNNKLYANDIANPEYCIVGNSQMLTTDTVHLILSINEKTYSKLLVYYSEQSPNAVTLEDGTKVGCWSIVSNGEELAIDTINYDVMTISAIVKRFSTQDGTTELMSRSTGETTENVYAGEEYTPKIPATEAEQIENILSILEATKQDKESESLTTTDHTVIGAINELNSAIETLEETKQDAFTEEQLEAMENVVEFDDRVEALERKGGLYITKNTNGDDFRTLEELNNAEIFYSNGQEIEVKFNDYCLIEADLDKATIVPNYNTFTDIEDYIGYYILRNGASTLVTIYNVETLEILPSVTVCYYFIPESRYIYQDDAGWKFQYTVDNEPTSYHIDDGLFEIVKNEKIGFYVEDGIFEVKSN